MRRRQDCSTYRTVSETLFQGTILHYGNLHIGSSVHTTYKWPCLVQSMYMRVSTFSILYSKPLLCYLLFLRTGSCQAHSSMVRPTVFVILGRPDTDATYIYYSSSCRLPCIPMCKCIISSTTILDKRCMKSGIYSSAVPNLAVDDVQ